MSDITPLIPRQPVPDLSLPLVGGGTWALRSNPPEIFSLLVFYRGFHCPICRTQLRDLQSRLYDFASRGVRVVAVSTDNHDRAESTRRDWGLDRLTIAHGLRVAQAREWGLYVSTHLGTTSIGVEEPRQFNEPGMFLVEPDGTLYMAIVQSVPFARPPLSDLLNAIDFVTANGYPARGEVVTV